MGWLIARKLLIIISNFFKVFQEKGSENSQSSKPKYGSLFHNVMSNHNNSDHNYHKIQTLSTNLSHQPPSSPPPPTNPITQKSPKVSNSTKTQPKQSHN